jgi:hypothetical protein
MCFISYAVSTHILSHLGLAPDEHKCAIVKNIKIRSFAENPEKSLNEQLRIVDILDKFDTLTTPSPKASP